MDVFAYRASQYLITAGFLLTILEWLSTYFMLPVLGTVGIPVLFKDLPTAPGALLPRHRGLAVVGGRELRVQPGYDCAVLSTMRGRSLFSARSAWPFKCTIHLDSSAGVLRLVARMPFGLPVFLAGWFLPFLSDRDTSMILGGLLILALVIGFEIYQSLDSAMSVARGLNGHESRPAV